MRVPLWNGEGSIALFKGTQQLGNTTSHKYGGARESRAVLQRYWWLSRNRFVLVSVVLLDHLSPRSTVAFKLQPNHRVSFWLDSIRAVDRSLGLEEY